jgi:cytochrome c2
MRKIPIAIAVLLILGVGPAGCGGTEPAPSADATALAIGDPATGKSLFERDAQPPCTSCHSLEPDFVLAGPSLAHIGAEAGSRVPGVSAEEYLRTSILHPATHIAPGRWDNTMLETYRSQLSEQQVDDMVAYLLTLK